MAEEILKQTRHIHENSLKNLKPQRAGEPGHNPKGRPKKADCLIECIKAELESKSLNGKSTKEQMIAAALVGMAERGNLKAIEMVLEYTVAKPKSESAVELTGKIPVPTFIFQMPDGTKLTAGELKERGNP